MFATRCGAVWTPRSGRFHDGAALFRPHLWRPETGFVIRVTPVHPVDGPQVVYENGAVLGRKLDGRTEPMSQVTIYHNPQCGTSRKVLAAVRDAGVEPRVIEYLKNPPDRATLADLVRRSGLPIRDLMRRKGAPYDELGLDDPKWSDEDLIGQMLAHPILINRPIVVTDKGVRLCRPPEVLDEIFPA